MLLTHGYGATCRMWDEQIEAFTDRFRLLVWDLPGHGRSLEFDLGPDDLIAHMEKMLDRAKVKRAVLGGLGIGASLALRFWRAHPARVRGLVLIGAMPGLRGGAVRSIWNNQVELQASLLEREGLAALEGGAEVDPGQHTSAMRLATATRRLLARTDDEALPWLREIDVPVLILAGSEDRPNLSAAHFMAREIPDARIQVITRANHAVTLDKSDAANAAIDAFSRRLPR